MDGARNKLVKFAVKVEHLAVEAFVLVFTHVHLGVVGYLGFCASTA